LAGGERYEDIGCHLILVDIHVEKIYWEVPIKRGVFLNSVLDSLLFFTDNTYATIARIAIQQLDYENFQQVGWIEPKLKKINLVGEEWKYPSEKRVRPWLNGLILANSRYWDGVWGDNHYALLDTVAGTMELWQPTGEFEWLNECMDAKWSSIGGLCLKEIPDTLGFVLLKNGIDTLAIRYMPSKLSVSEDGVGNIKRSLIFTGNSIISNGWIYLMSEHGQISENPLDVWVYSQMGYIFRNFYGSGVHYNKKILH